jgi:hypothetical protein
MLFRAANWKTGSAQFGAAKMSSSQIMLSFAVFGVLDTSRCLGLI